MGHRKSRAMQALGLGAAIFETWEGLRIEGRSHAELNPLKQGSNGWITRAGACSRVQCRRFCELASIEPHQRMTSILVPIS
jgi:hypothetical protein